MLNNNKTYDNRNLRDRQKVFNDGFCEVYEAKERELGEHKGRYYFSKESVSYNSFDKARQDGEKVVMAIGIPCDTACNHGDAVQINDEWYTVDYAQLKTYNVPVWLKVFLTKPTLPYRRRNLNE